jgi:hypothetical protein
MLAGHILVELDRNALGPTKPRPRPIQWIGGAAQRLIHALIVCVMVASNCANLVGM